MAKKKHVIHGCKARLRPKIAGIKKRVYQEVAVQINDLKEMVSRREQDIRQLSDDLKKKDHGRSLKSHLQGWWSHRNA